MPRISVFLILIFATACGPQGEVKREEAENRIEPVLVIHGGAGTIKKGTMTPDQERAYHAALNQALEEGFAILSAGGKSIDAVGAAISVLEDSPLFNAGKGAVFTADGKNELDASIMDGSNLKAGAVAGVTTIRNPIKAARAVMDQSPHVMLSGKGADDFARELGLEIVDPGYFKDPIKYEQFLKRNKQEGEKDGAALPPASPDKKFGTVGAVAIDRFGNIAAGTSTGGMSNKKWGRIGDSPIIGAGTYADNQTCGVSATGWGEFFIRLSVAHDISAMMRYGDFSLQEAADEVILKKLPRLGGDGGIIAVDKRGNIAMVFNTEGMYRGYIRQKGEATTLLYKE